MARLLRLGHGYSLPLEPHGGSIAVPSWVRICAIAATCDGIVITGADGTAAAGDDGDAVVALHALGPPQPLPLALGEDRIRQIVSGMDTFAIVTVSGAVHLWGVDPDLPSLTLTPSRAPWGMAVADLSLGTGCLLLVDTHGTVFACGTNRHGGLGRPDLPHAARPVPIALPGGAGAIATVCCQWACHCVAVTAKGRVVVWGTNLRGQLGLGTVSATERLPQLLETLPSIVPIRSARTTQHSTVLLSEWGDVYVMGDCGPSGVLMLPTLVEVFGIPGGSVPSTTAILEDVTAIACGSAHTLLLRSDGQVLAFGDNRHGQCGVPAHITRQSAATATGSADSAPPLPRPVACIPADGLHATAVACGYWSSFVLRTPTP